MAEFGVGVGRQFPQQLIQGGQAWTQIGTGRLLGLRFERSQLEEQVGLNSVHGLGIARSQGQSKQGSCGRASGGEKERRRTAGSTAGVALRDAGRTDHRVQALIRAGEFAGIWTVTVEVAGLAVVLSTSRSKNSVEPLSAETTTRTGTWVPKLRARTTTD